MPESRCGCAAPTPVMVEIQGAYDGGLFWECTSCGHSWHRWPEGTALHRIANQYMSARNARRAEIHEPEAPTHD